MSIELQEMVRFHRTGQRTGGELNEAATPGICSALLDPYRQLTKLRYDYPLVFIDDGAGAFTESLSSAMDGVLQKIAPQGSAGMRTRSHILRLEAKIRELVADGEEGSLAQLWSSAEQALLAGVDDTGAELLSDSLARARSSLQIDGPVIDCDERTPARLIEHAWAAHEARRTREALDRIRTLTLNLRNMLKVDDLKASGSRTPRKLKLSLGGHYQDAFDFGLMSRLLKQAAPKSTLPPRRRHRIQSALSILEAQKFFARPGESGKRPKNKARFRFVFDSVADALKVYNERLPEMAEFTRAMVIAELEIENQYRESRHDEFLERFDARSLGQADLQFFPSYLICIDESDLVTRKQAELLEVLAADLPMKVLVRISDALGNPLPSDRHVPHDIRGQQLANMAVGLGDAYVLQSASSNLYQLRDGIRAGLAFHGPSLFSVFSGSAANTPDIPLYLTAASAMESRAFPAFTYDPTAEDDLAARFRMRDNPQAGNIWPVQKFSYEDEELQRHTENVAFTHVDFAALDRRYAGYFAEMPRDSWTEKMAPVGEYLELSDEEAEDKVPYVLMVDGRGIMHRLVVDDKLVHSARRCGQRWHRLQELGGINNSHAQALLERERAVWEEQKAKELAKLQSGTARTDDAGETAPVADRTAVDAPVEIKEEAGSPAASMPVSNDPYIETPRCTTCDECTNRNNRMFAYDENKQAYIADPAAGTFRELVEAAEECQVCIIHPGKPRNPDEPGLAGLIKRAELFN
jgi:hypothetical protein